VRAPKLTLVLGAALLFGSAGQALATPKPEPAPRQPASGLRPDPAPAAQAPSSASSSASAPTVQSPIPALAAPTPAAVSPPAPAQSSSVSPAASTTAHKTQKPRGAVTKHLAHTTSAVHRFVRLPGLLFESASFQAIGNEAASASASRSSRMLLAGGLALALLVIGETTFLALAGAKLGFRPRRRPRRAYRG